jgi:ParB-like chromosome segregation protein Spo0J
MTVIDGLHRLAVAKERGDSEIEVQLADGGEFDLIALATRLNVTHGLPLSLEDRRMAVRRLLSLRPEWSDRRLGRTAGVSPALVSKIRDSLEDSPASGSRVGLDGKARPLLASEGRLRVAALLAERSGAPVRELAAAAGVSVSTAQDVRNRVSRGLDPLPKKLQEELPQGGAGLPEATDTPPMAQRTMREGQPRDRAHPGPAKPDARAAEHSVTLLRGFDHSLRSLRNDPSVRSTDAGRTLVRVLALHERSIHILDRLASFVPPHRKETVAGLAHMLAAAWTQFAGELDHRQRYSKVPDPRSGLSRTPKAVRSPAAAGAGRTA